MSANPYVAPGSNALVPVIQGPHSPWPRKRRVSTTGKIVSASAGATALGVFVHCAGPVLF